MRRLPAYALVLLCALSACKREPSFEERYAGAEKEIRAKAEELDREMSTRASEAAISTDAAAREPDFGGP